MLILTRRLGEKILIGDNITITLVRIKGNQVRIGIEAPPDVTVTRSELEDAGSTRSSLCADLASAIGTALACAPTVPPVGASRKRPLLRLPAA